MFKRERTHKRTGCFIILHKSLYKKTSTRENPGRSYLGSSFIAFLSLLQYRGRDMLLMCIVVGFSWETNLKTARTFRQLYERQWCWSWMFVQPSVIIQFLQLERIIFPLTGRITMQILTCFINIYHHNAPLFRRTSYSCSKVLKRQKQMNKPRDSFIMITWS